jgi:hypothetical protein
MREYSLVTRWHLDAQVARVWDALVAVECWPCWWRFVDAIVELENGDADGVGALRRYVWSSRLPYRLSFEMRTTAVERYALMEAVATGELNGVGRWRLSTSGETTRVRYEWTVATAKRWMNLLSPILAPAFRWNHDQVMAEGGRGLARYLGVRLIANLGSSDPEASSFVTGSRNDSAAPS